MNSKAAQERLQRILMDLVRQPGNDVCADCKGRAPRWASWNLGIFICVQCAGVHRKMGVHISKVKSLTLDTWTREQVDRMKEMGNIKSNKIYNPDEMRNRPPTNMEESERDSELEKYIRRKYEFRRFVEGRPPPVPTKDATFLTSPPPSTSKFGSLRSPGEASLSSHDQSNLAEGKSIARSRTAPIPGTWHEAQQRAKANAPALPSGSTSAFRSASGSAAIALSTASQSSLQAPSTAVPLRTSSALNTKNENAATTGAKTTTATAQSSVFDDLISLSEPSQPPVAQPPLQMNPWAAMQAQQQAVLSASAIQEPTGNFWAGQGAISGASSPVSPFGVSPSNQIRSMPQHANTAPTLVIPSGPNQMTGQATGMLSPGNGMMYSPYQQQAGAALGAMAFSASPIASPNSAVSNPFTMQSNFASSLPQAGVNGYQQQQLGQVAFQGQVGAASMSQQPQQQQFSNPNGFNQFQTSMMPNGYGQSGQFVGPFMQQQPAQQQHTQQGSQFGNMW